jgi:sortase A
MEKEELKTLIKPFIVVFVILLLIFNWSEISWIFNYRFISTLFTNGNEIVANGENNNQSDNDDNNAPANSENYSSKENSLEIAKIAVQAPLISVVDAEIATIEEGLDRGVVHYPDSVLPGEPGDTIVLGHSAPENWPDINYDDVFSELNNLEKDDIIFLYFNHQKYVYSVVSKEILEKGEDIQPSSLTNNENMLILISCWPPGKNYQRIAVRSVIQEN